MDRVSIERMFAGREFQVEGKEICIGRTEGSGRKIVRNEFRGREAERYECFPGSVTTWKTLDHTQPLI